MTQGTSPRKKGAAKYTDVFEEFLFTHLRRFRSVFFPASRGLEISGHVAFA